MERKGSTIKGIFYILLSAFGFSVMNICVTLSGDLPTFQKALFRNAGALVLSLVLFLKSGEKLDTDKGDLLVLLLRSVFGSIGVISNFYALDHLLVSDASMLNKLAPFFTLVLSSIFLKEKVNWKQYLLVGVAFRGTLFIVKPSMSFSSNMGASMIGILGGFGAGAAYTCVRALGKRKMPSSQIVFGFSLISTLIAIPFVIIDHKAMTVEQMLILAVGTMGATLGQFGITWAYKEAPSREISIFDYFTVIFTAVWGFLFLSQVPDMLSLLGYLIMFSSAYVMFLYNRRHTS
ncbi:MAG: DMT family transporter [Candidatus Ornithospirochaeta sp.]